MIKKLLTVLSVAAMLGACSTVASVQSTVSDKATQTKEFALRGFKQAAKEATYGGDKHAAMCFNGVVDILEQINTDVATEGEFHPVVKYERARLLRRSIENIPEEVKDGCTLMLDESKSVLTGLLSRFGVAIPGL